MSRSITGTVDAALASPNVPMLVFVELDFASGIVRVCNAAYAFDWDGHTWGGLGTLGRIEPVQEGAELQAYGISMQLSGVPTGMVAVALGEQYQGRPCKVWLAPLDDAYTVLADPVLVFHGRIDTMGIDLGETAVITLTAESRLSDWDRPRVRRFNHEDQIAEYPDDMGFEFVPQMAEKELVWGRS